MSFLYGCIGIRKDWCVQQDAAGKGGIAETETLVCSLLICAQQVHTLVCGWVCARAGGIWYAVSNNIC